MYSVYERETSEKVKRKSAAVFNIKNYNELNKWCVNDRTKKKTEKSKELWNRNSTNRDRDRILEPWYGSWFLKF